MLDRSDIGALRLQIKETVGADVFDKYWLALRHYFVAKLSKRELDFAVGDLLGEHGALRDAHVRARTSHGRAGGLR